ncbi:B12-binding domain-containing radical SAM protein [Ekhidna sp.]|uniref:B12-binding domain-containing radical SAM protein n=1 Tax=Ekhidna sp. TaxID=2608089 RepID=UPI0032975B55
MLAELLLITPPFTQLNTPYPATAYLKGFFNSQEINVAQQDLGIEVILNLFSKQGLTNLFKEAEVYESPSKNVSRILALKENYLTTIEPVIAFLQGKNPALARQICADPYLPQASRFGQLEEMDWAFGNMGMQDKAKHLATLYLEDLSDLIVECADHHFGFSRYAERLGRSTNSFDELNEELNAEPTFIDAITLKLLDSKIQSTKPKVVGFSVPFPGNLYSAFRCAQYLKANHPRIKITMGGGFPNTELRDLKDPRVFDYIDFITLDDGERPMQLLLEHIREPKEDPYLKRTFCRIGGQVSYINNAKESDIKQSEAGTPDYTGLLLDDYISVIEVANPMHSLWSDGRWNKLTMAHGCYWGKCTFCDISLDYIKVYEPIAARTLVDRMEQMIDQTGFSGFHFVDEAAPPALMKELALEILKRKLSVTWWTNIRFEKSFTRDLCMLLKASGCIAFSGGLEVASDRLLKLIDKGVTVDQVARVTNYFTEAGIMVHAYLMYGYPTQTVQETIDSLEMVKQLFALGIIQSGFWHQFAMTAHSPVGLNPEAFGVIPNHSEIGFANNDVDFTDKTGIDHSIFSFGLKKSLYNFMHGMGFDWPVQEWFEEQMPATTIAPTYIEDALDQQEGFTLKSNARVVWLGGYPEMVSSKKGKIKVLIHGNNDTVNITLPQVEGTWLLEQLEKLKVDQRAKFIKELKESFEKQHENFELFWFSKPVNILKKYGLLTI